MSWGRAPDVGVVDVPEGAAVDAGARGEERGGAVYLGRLPDGPITVLSGASAVLFRALVAPVPVERVGGLGGDTRSADLVGTVARGLGVDPGDIDPEAITEFAEELESAGLLTRQRD